MLHCSLTVNPWTVSASSYGAGTKRFSTAVSGALYSSRLLQLECEFLFSALGSHLVSSEKAAFPELDATTPRSEWPQASSGVNSLLPSRPK